MTVISVEPDLADLVGSMGQLWKATEAADPDRGLIRSLTQNIVIVTDDRHLEDIREVAEAILDRHPCRLFLLVVGEDSVVGDGPRELRGELHGETRQLNRCRAMVLEQLVLFADWSQFAKLPSLIRPLLVNDIPTSLFWATRLPESLGRIAALATMTDRTVVDSTLFEGDDWRSLRQLSDPRPFDLAWLRLAPWRRIVAEAFEFFEWEIEEPPTEVILEHGGSFGSLAASRCLEHWLVEKLSADVRLVELPGDGPEREPWRLDLTFGDVQLQVRHAMTEAKLRLDLTMHDRCLLPTSTMSSRGTRGHLLAAALDL